MHSIQLANNHDEEDVKRGHLRPHEVRAVQIQAVADPGATMLVLPADVVGKLGLFPDGYRKVRDADGRIRELAWVSSIRMTILGRETVTNALVADAGSTPVVGQIPLEELDLVVDPQSRDLRVNPESPDAPLLDVLSAA
ncbi:MAG TPA: clan AA aspartic protease [Polyangia bacterium]|nr:clan AA aspartic protease [Polyangia bacterium]